MSEGWFMFLVIMAVLAVLFGGILLYAITWEQDKYKKGDDDDED